MPSARKTDLYLWEFAFCMAYWWAFVGLEFSDGRQWRNALLEAEIALGQALHHLYRPKASSFPDYRRSALRFVTEAVDCHDLLKASHMVGRLNGLLPTVPDEGGFGFLEAWARCVLTFMDAHVRGWAEEYTNQRSPHSVDFAIRKSPQHATHDSLGVTATWDATGEEAAVVTICFTAFTPERDELYSNKTPGGFLGWEAVLLPAILAHERLHGIGTRVAFASTDDESDFRDGWDYRSFCLFLPSLLNRADTCQWSVLPHLRMGETRDCAVPPGIDPHDREQEPPAVKGWRCHKATAARATVKIRIDAEALPAGMPDADMALSELTRQIASNTKVCSSKGCSGRGSLGVCPHMESFLALLGGDSTDIRADLSDIGDHGEALWGAIAASAGWDVAGT